MCVCVCVCVCGMPGHRAGWHASVENSHLNCRSCSCARPSPRDCSRLIDSSKQREQLRHGTLSEPGATERKIFPTPSALCLGLSLETNYSVPRTRLTPYGDERATTSLATPESCQFLFTTVAVHGEHVREGPRVCTTRNTTRSNASCISRLTVGIVSYGTSCRTKGCSY